MIDSQHRVVVTGVGVISAIGNNYEDMVIALKNGTCGISDCNLFKTEEFYYHKIGQIKNLPEYNESSDDRATKLVRMATNEALDKSGLNIWSDIIAESTGVCIGTTCGGIQYHEDIVKKMLNSEKISNKYLKDFPFFALSNNIANDYNVGGPVSMITIACASGLNSITYASDCIKNGHAKYMICGGSDTVSRFTFSGFSSLRAMCRDECRPFDKNRTGIALGEGAAIFILESYEHAKNRNANIYGEILGGGFYSDAFHSTNPDPSGKGMQRSIECAIKDSNISTDQIDYINAHGTGTRANDKMEYAAFKNVWKEKLETIPVSSTKSMIGHTLGAAGAIEMAATIASINEGFLPPTVNHIETDPEFKMDVVPNIAREKEINHALCCNAGFAGNNCAVVVGKI